MDWNKSFVDEALDEVLHGPSGEPISAPLVPVAYIAKLVAQNAVYRCMWAARTEIDAQIKKVDELESALDCARDELEVARKELEEMAELRERAVCSDKTAGYWFEQCEKLKKRLAESENIVSKGGAGDEGT